MTINRLEDDADAFRAAAHQAVEWIADYVADPERFPVLSRSRPGDTRRQFEDRAPLEGRSYDELLEEFRTKILPGVTHWNHPGFMAYFAITGSPAGILGEMLSGALNINGMLWRTSPAATELETLTLDWLVQLLGLPSDWFGIINDTASINVFLAIAAAREATGFNIREEGVFGRNLPPMRVYISDQTHSSAEKAALALGFGTRGVRKIESDDAFRMRPDALRAAIEEDVRNGVRPCAIVATTGTTSTAAIDSVEEIGKIAEEFGAWFHVDAAYGGSAAIVPEHRAMWKGIERVDSLVVNPHKWMFTPVDCSVLYTRRPDVLKETFSLVPEYLKTGESEVIDYMNYGLQLGRRFRALKLWLVLAHYGEEKLRAVIASHIEMAERLARELAARPDIELLAPQSLGVVVFRKVIRKGGAVVEDESEQATADILERANASGSLFLSHTRLRGKYAIRVAIGHASTEWRHLQNLLSHLEG